MPAIGAILAWVFALFSNCIVWLTSAVLGQVVATQVADVLMRVIRVAAVFALFVTAINLVIPNGVPLSVTALWDQYVADSSPWLAKAGWLIPFDLLFSLVDLYLLGASVVLAIWVVRRLVEASQ